MLDNHSLETLSFEHQEQFLNFCNQYIGKNYFNANNFKLQLELSEKENLNASYVLLNVSKKIIGVRLTYAPGKWLTKIKTKHLSELNIDPKQIGYFKSLFIHPDHQGKKIGPYLSNQSISCLLYTSPSPRDRTRSRMPSSA